MIISFGCLFVLEITSRKYMYTLCVYMAYNRTYCEGEIHMRKKIRIDYDCFHCSVLQWTLQNLKLKFRLYHIFFGFSVFSILSCIFIYSYIHIFDSVFCVVLVLGDDTRSTGTMNQFQNIHCWVCRKPSETVFLTLFH